MWGLSGSALLFLGRTLSLRRLVSSPIRTILVTAAVAMGVALFLASVIAGEASVASFASSSSESTRKGVLTCHEETGALNESDVATIFALASSRFTVLPIVEFLATTDDAPVRIFGFDSQLCAGDTSSSIAPSLIERSALVSPESPLAQPDRIEKGVELHADGIAIKLPIVVVKNPIVAQKRAIYIDLSLLERWLSHRSTFSTAYLIPRDDKRLSSDEYQQLRDDIQRTNPSLDLETDEEQAGRMDSLLGAFRMNVLVMVFMTLIVTGLLVENAMRVQAFHAIREVQILRTLGVTGWGASALLLVDSLTIGFIGSLAGLILGYPVVSLVSTLLLRTAQEMYLPDLAFASLGLGSLITVYGVAFGVGMIVSVGGGIFPALQARQVVPVLTGRPDEGIARPVSYGRDLLILILCVGGITASLHYSWHHEALTLSYGAVLLLVVASYLLVSLTVHSVVRYLGDSIKRTPTVITLLAAGSSEVGEREVARSVRTTAAGLALLLGLSLLVTSFRMSLQEWVSFTFSHDLFVKPVTANDPRNPSVLSPNAVEKVGKLTGVSQILRTRGYLTNIEGVATSVYGIELEAGDAPPTMQFLAGRYREEPFRRGEGVLLSESGARRLRRKVGDRLPLLGRSLPILAIYRDYTRERATILVGWEPFIASTGNSAPESMSVRYTQDADQERVRASVEKIFNSSAVSVLSMGELRGRIDELFKSTFAITGVLRGIILLVSLAGFLIASMQRYGAREGELRTVRALGVSSGELALAAAIEGSLAIVPALIVGGVAGGVLGWILIGYVNPLSFGWSLTFHVDWGSAFVSIGAFLLIAAACSATAAVLVYRRTSRGGWHDE